MSEFFNQRAQAVKNSISKAADRILPHGGVFLAIAAVAAFLIAPRHVWAAAVPEVSYSVSNNGGNNVNATAATLNAAIDNASPLGINNALAATGAVDSYTADISLDINADQALTAAPANAYGAWIMHGTADSATFGTVYGFNNITVSGRSATDMTVLNGNGKGMLLKILHAKAAITVQNLKVTGGAFSAADIPTSGAFGNQIGGAGMTLGGNGVSPSKGPTRITLKNVDAHANAITLTNAVTAANVYGAGILVNAYGTDGTPGGTRGEVSFQDVNVTGNTINVTNGGSVTATAMGGGARIYGSSQFAYTTGVVSGNTISLKNGDHAAGGGLSIDNGALSAGANTKVTFSEVSFLRNKAAVINARGAGGGTAYARGGGLYYRDIKTGAPTALTFDKTTIFDGNQAIAAIDGGGSALDQLTAHGGAAFLVLDTTNATFTGTVFKNNSAISARGEGSGGALVVATEGSSASGSLTLTDASFADNVAEGSTNAYGGAVLSITTTSHTFTDTDFSNNRVTAKGGGAANTAAGGAVSFLAGNNTLSGGKLHGNQANALGAGNASGGAAHFTSGNQTISGQTYTGNSAVSAASGTARGGAIYFGATTSSTTSAITDTTLSGNAASAAATGGTAQGGAIYFEQGTLTITNSSIVGNRVAGGTAQGSAIYMNTDNATTPAADDATLNLAATTGKTLRIAGNTVNGSETTSGIHFGNASGGTSLHNARLAISGSGDVELLNPVTVTMNNGKNFTMVKDGSGRMKWDGINSFSTVGGTAAIQLDNGSVEFGKNFTARATGNTNFTIAIASTAGNPATQISFDVARSGTLAIFDFTGTTGAKTLTVASGTTITAGLGRQLRSFSGTYTIADGLTNTQVNDLLRALRSQENNNGVSPYLHNNGSGALLATVAYDSPFEKNANSARSLSALERLLQGEWGRANISDAEVGGMRLSAENITPGLFMEQSYVMINGVDYAARSAIDYGLRHSHRARLRLESGYGPAPVPRNVDAYGYPIPESDGYSSDYYHGSGTAYPSLADCEPAGPKGIRFWSGYIGDWYRMDSHGGFNGYRAERNGILLGANYDFGDMASLGVYGGYSQSNTRARGIDSKVKSDVGHLGVIGRISPFISAREFSIYADVGHHWSSNDIRRGLAGWNASGSFDQRTFTAGLGIEHVFQLGNLNVVPHVEARYFDLHQDSMTESGVSATATRISGYDKGAFNTRIGVEMVKEMRMGGMLVSPTVALAWRHEYGNSTHNASAFFTKDPFPMPFTVSSSNIDRDSMDIGGAIKTLKSLESSTVGFNLSYTFNLSKNTHTHSLYAGFELGF